MKYKCPRCGSTDNLSIFVHGWADFRQEPARTFVPDMNAWDKSCGICCQTCGNQGNTETFEVKT